MTFLIDSAIRMSVVLGVALLAMVFLRKRSAAARHWVLSAAVLCAALMPVGTLLLPSWNLSPAASKALSVSVLTRTFSDGRPHEPMPSVTTSASALSWPVMVWLAGSSVSFLALGVGFARLLMAVRRSERVTRGNWFRIAQSLSRQFRLKRQVQLLSSQSPAMLVTWGFLRPEILLPAGSELWSEERISVVLQHEMAHVRRNDWLLHTAAELLRIVYWFNPLLWIVCRRLRLESEYAADDAVLAQGVSSSRYAAHLLEIVRTLQQTDRAWSAASAMARPSTIERRFSAMLNPAKDRRPICRVTMAAVAIVLLCTSLSLAALRSSASIPVVAAAVAAAPQPAIEPSALPVAQAAPSPEAAAPARRGQQPQAPTATTPTTKYTGELISLDLKNVDIKDFLRLIGDVGGLSLVIDRDVTGDITLVLKEIPWDAALDIVANNKQLGLEVQGKVLHVSSKPQVIPQGRIVLDFEVFKSGKLLGRPRIATAGRIAAELTQADFTISVTPTEVAPNKVELNLAVSISGEKFAARLPVSKDMPGKIIWETAGDSFEVRVVLAAAP